VVLIRACTLLLVGLVVGLLGGCGESLFDARGPADGGRPDGGSPDGGGELGICATPCIADASADFDGTPAGRTSRWRYLDDLGNRQWTQMTVDGMRMVGNAARSVITTCAANPDKPACEALPRALLVTSAGAAGGAGAGGSDPAIEFTAPSAQGIELRVRAFLPAGDSQQIRLYRNSREDVLFTGIAAPGATLDQTVTLDALAGDRFLVAIAASGATGGGATDLGLHLTITATNTAFPASCQLALDFESQTGSNVIDLCGGAVYSLRRVPEGTLAPLNRPAGPFFEQGKAGRITEGTHFSQLGTSKTLDHTAGLTIQFWMQHAVPIGVQPVWPFSDHDPEFGSGVAVTLQAVGQVAPMIDVTGFADGSFVHAVGPYPLEVMRWQFVRVVHTATEIALCINGVRVAEVAATNAAIPTVNAPVLGSEQFPSLATFDGSLDDVRAITGALPCE
jgi:hypothetical protein